MKWLIFFIFFFPSNGHLSPGRAVHPTGRYPSHVTAEQASRQAASDLPGDTSVCQHGWQRCAWSWQLIPGAGAALAQQGWGPWW